MRLDLAENSLWKTIDFMQFFPCFLEREMIVYNAIGIELTTLNNHLWYNQQIKKDRRKSDGLYHYFAYSTALVSRMTLTLI